MISLDYWGLELINCLVCGRPNADKHHWRTRKSGGSEDGWNKMLLCREHHTEVHKIGATTFASKYEIVMRWLLKNGWQLCEVSKKWRRYDV